MVYPGLKKSAAAIAPHCATKKVLRVRDVGDRQHGAVRRDDESPIPVPPGDDVSTDQVLVDPGSPPHAHTSNAHAHAGRSMSARRTRRQVLLARNGAYHQMRFISNFRIF